MSAVILSFRTDDTTKNMIEMITHKKNITKTQLINDALKAYLSTVDPKITQQMKILHAVDSDADYLTEDF